MINLASFHLRIKLTEKDSNIIFHTTSPEDLTIRNNAAFVKKGRINGVREELGYKDFRIKKNLVNQINFTFYGCNLFTKIIQKVFKLKYTAYIF